MWDTGYDGYYEDQCYVAACEAEAEQEYQNYLEKLIKEGKHTLFAVEVAIDWLRSEERSKSKLSDIEFLHFKRQQIIERMNNGKKV